MSTKRFFPSSTSILPLVPSSSFPPLLHPDGHRRIFDPYWSCIPGSSSSSRITSNKFDIGEGSDRRLERNKPFWKDERHRLPVRWELYKPLLEHLKKVDGIIFSGINVRKREVHATDGSILSGREETGNDTSSDIDELEKRKVHGNLRVRVKVLREEIRRRWTKNRHLTSPAQTRRFLNQQEELLDALETLLAAYSSSSSSEMDLNQTKLSERLDHILVSQGINLNSVRRMAEAKGRDGLKKKTPETKPTRSFLTGGLIRPSLFNLPLPRIKPQPIEISMMIHHRLRAYERTWKDKQMWEGWKRDMKEEERFLGRVGVGRIVGTGWDTEATSHVSYLSGLNQRAYARSKTVFDEATLQRVAHARTERRKAKWKMSMAKKAKREDTKEEGKSVPEDDIIQSVGTLERAGEVKI